jgi:hypothetical protein
MYFDDRDELAFCALGASAVTVKVGGWAATLPSCGMADVDDIDRLLSAADVAERHRSKRPSAQTSIIGRGRCSRERGTSPGGGARPPAVRRRSAETRNNVRRRESPAGSEHILLGAGDGNPSDACGRPRTPQKWTVPSGSSLRGFARRAIAFGRHDVKCWLCSVIIQPDAPTYSMLGKGVFVVHLHCFERQLGVSSSILPWTPHGSASHPILTARRGGA